MEQACAPWVHPTLVSQLHSSSVSLSAGWTPVPNVLCIPGTAEGFFHLRGSPQPGQPSRGGLGRRHRAPAPQHPLPQSSAGR